MYITKIKRGFRQSLLKFNLLLLLLFSYTGISQIVENQHIEVFFDSIHPDRAIVRHHLYFQRKLHPGDTILFYNYLGAYADIHSELGKSIAGQYKLEFHFSSKKERGYVHIKPSSTYDFKVVDGFIKIFPASQTDSLIIGYEIKLSHRKFTGLGYSKKKYHLLEFFLQEAVDLNGKRLLYQNKNLDDRPHLPVSTRISLYHPDSTYKWESNAKIERHPGYILLSHPNTSIEITGSISEFEKYRTGNNEIIMEKNIFHSPAHEFAGSLEKVLAFLNREKIPVPSKILITRRDLEQNPVYGADWLPVLNPFPPEFKLETNLLKQILYKSGKELFWDRRKDHAIFTGLWQYYLQKYIRLYYPEIRLTGTPVRFPVLRGYYMFRVPYTDKYKQLYLYMARMNRDQALDLPADNLTRFNRNVTNPYKAALGWEFAAKYLDQNKIDTIIREWFALAKQNYAGTDNLRALFEKHTGNKADFLFSDYYHTAKKIDFKIRNPGVKTKKRTIKLSNITGFDIPASVEIYQKKRVRQFFIPAFNGDTLIRLTDKPIHHVTINGLSPLAEINEKNNFIPFTRKPLKIRFFQDLEDSHSIQLYINPKFDYNLYDGFILGLGLNNSSFFDKKFTWEVIPEYGFKSKYLGGYAAFRYKKHFMRPFLHGFSLGGYYKSFHYAPAKTYLTYSIYATLSHKNRKEKFFKENDLTLEWLRIDKETDHPDITSSYGIAILRNRYMSRGLLRRMHWTGSMEWHPKFVKLQSDFRFRTFIDKYRQIEWRIFAGWMPVNQTGSDYFSFALSRPTDYLFKYNYYGRSETKGIFYQQYVYAEGAFKIFFPDQFANQWMFTNNVYIGLYKRLNIFVDFGWMKNSGRPAVFHYDAGFRYYFIPDFFELYFPVLYDGKFLKPDKTYFNHIRIMFVFDLTGLAKIFTRSWY